MSQTYSESDLKKLLDSGLGNRRILGSILEKIRSNKPIPTLDKKYLATLNLLPNRSQDSNSKTPKTKKSSQTHVTQKTTQITSKSRVDPLPLDISVSNVKQFLRSGTGNRRILGSILEKIRLNEPISTLDKKYLAKLEKEQRITTEKPKPKTELEKPKKEPEKPKPKTELEKPKKEPEKPKPKTELEKPKKEPEKPKPKTELEKTIPPTELEKRLTSMELEKTIPPTELEKTIPPTELEKRLTSMELEKTIPPTELEKPPTELEKPPTELEKPPTEQEKTRAVLTEHEKPRPFLIEQEKPRSVFTQPEKPRSVFTEQEKPTLTQPEKPTLTQPEKPKLDPIQIFLVIGVFGTLFSLAFLTLTWYSIIAIGLSVMLTSYFFLVGKKPTDVTKKGGQRRMSVFGMMMLATPFVMGIVMAIDGTLTFYSLPQTLMLLGLVISFWNLFLFIPLSVQNRYTEMREKKSTRQPSVTVIIPAYNEETVVEKTIQAAIDAPYPHKEIIFVDDGSTDGTLNVVLKYKKQIKVVHQENGGKATALNTGVRYSRGEIIVIIDADTIIARNGLLEIVKGFTNENVVAVAGNIKIRNRVNLLTNCQALEYVTAIQIMRRALDFFGAITIVPGALGAFRRKPIVQAGGYKTDTLVEDYDLTMKLLKSGKIIKASNDAISFCETPESLYDYYKQRKRWYRGNLQILRRHSDAISNPRFGMLHKLALPFMILGMLVLPIIGMMVTAASIVSLALGEWEVLAIMMAHFILLTYLVSALAVRIDKSDPKLIAYAIFFVIGYKQIVDFLLIKALFEMLLHKKAVWTSAKRVGFETK